jgi:hypothetical protein
MPTSAGSVHVVQVLDLTRRLLREAVVAPVAGLGVGFGRTAVSKIKPPNFFVGWYNVTEW